MVGRRSLLLAGVAFPASAYGQCVTDRFAVDACMGGVRGALGPPGQTLDLNFMSPGALDPRITFTRASSATYTDASGVIQTAATNAPRWDYAGGVLRGLLLEDQRTNLVIHSDDLTFVANWPLSGTTIIVGTDLSPNGTQMMSKVTENTNTSTHYTSQTGVAVTNGALYTLSCFARASTRRYLQLALDDTINGAFATFDLQTGVVSQSLATRGAGATIGTASITNAGGGTYRCAITASIPATAARAIVLLSNGPTPGFAPNYLGNGTNALSVWGVQLEAGDFATSYIPTATVAVTRGIDICAISAANMSPWFTAPGGSWLAEFDYFDATPTNNARIIARSDMVSDVSPALITSANLAGQNDGVAVNGANAVTANAITKVATTWTAGQAKVCANGGAVASSASLATGYGALATGGIRLMSVGSGLSCEGHLRRLSYAPIVWSDAQMQAVTT
jgi:hypothetical protein